MIVTLVRHTSVNVPRGTCYGRTDVPLSDSFPEEAAKVAEQLQKMTFAAVFSSPAERCLRLAAACGFASPIVDDRLQELDFGSWEMQRFDEINDPRLQDWYADYVNVAPGGGESYAHQITRVDHFLKEMSKIYALAHILVFTHGGVIAAAKVAAGLVADPKDAFSSPTPYGSLTTLRIGVDGEG